MSKATLNPVDINDPAWIEAREAEWKVEVKDLKKWFSKSYIEKLRKSFLGDEFSYENGGDIHDGVRPWNFSPYQSERVWTDRLLDYASRLGRDYASKKEGRSFEDSLSLAISNYAGGFATTLDDPHEQVRLWGIDKAVDLKKFVYGDKFVDGNYEVLGFTLPYPKLPHKFVSSWWSGFQSWIYGYESDESGDCLSNHFMMHFVQAYRSLHPIFFGEPYLVSHENIDQINLRNVVANLREYDGNIASKVSEKIIKKMPAAKLEWRHEKLLELSCLLSEPTGIKHVDDFWQWVDPGDKERWSPEKGSKYYKELPPEKDPFYVPRIIHGA
ncbi:MAG: hypothetical protein KAG82_10820 [Alcanivoracaceae bacterium]|jgi:hypothetical protein|nr:hypothetical protein [Alcanivoracaceae bacterium]